MKEAVKIMTCLPMLSWSKRHVQLVVKAMIIMRIKILCLERGNSDNCEDGREASNDILNRLSHLLSKVRNRNNVGDSSSNEVPIADLTSQ
ncbi:hypothetical protein LguiA_027132 [Lonicera macranthoides]